jgi:apolipoprotein N-acyltransferase
MTTQKHIQLGRLTALISFLLGTGIFGLYYETSDSKLLFVGYGFVVLTGIVNIVVLIAILNRAAKDTGNSSKLNRTLGLMLLNIPVMLIYGWGAMILLNTMRITLTNSTSGPVSDIRIDVKHIDKLEPGQSETVWIAITGDGSISISYSTNGQQKTGIVAGYVTQNMGGKMNYYIGGKNDEPF